MISEKTRLKIRFISKVILAFIFLIFFTSAVFVLFSEEKPKSNFEGEIYVFAGITGLSLLFGLLLLSSGRKDYLAIKKGRTIVDLTKGSPTFQKFPAFFTFIDNISFNGFGTKLLTLHDQQQDGSFSAIQWFILGNFPIVPLYQVRLRFLNEKKSGIPLVYSISKTKVEKYEKEKLNYTLVRWTYAMFFLLFIPLIVLPIVLLLINLDYVVKHFPGPNFWWLILGYFIWGVSMYALWQIWNNRFFLSGNIKD